MPSGLCLCLALKTWKRHLDRQKALDAKLQTLEPEGTVVQDLVPPKVLSDDDDVFGEAGSATVGVCSWELASGMVSVLLLAKGDER